MLVSEALILDGITTSLLLFQTVTKGVCVPKLCVTDQVDEFVKLALKPKLAMFDNGTEPLTK